MTGLTNIRCVDCNVKNKQSPVAPSKKFGVNLCADCLIDRLAHQVAEPDQARPRGWSGLVSQ